MSRDRFKTVLRDRVAKTQGGATQIREMANIFDTMYGIPLPPMYLALQYLIGVDVVPLGRTVTLVGPPGSGKSIFGWFISTLFAQNNGFIGFVDAEDKTSWDQVDGVYRHSGLQCEDWFWRQHPKSQEQMFEHLTLLQQEMGKLIQDSKGPDYGVPLMYLVDSINYLASAERAEKRVTTNDQGAVGFAHAHKANNLTEYLQSFVPHAVSSWPSTLVTINHQKTKMDPGAGGGKQFAAPEKYEPGGVHKDFMYSLNIELSRGAKSMAKHTRDVRKKGIILKTKKSCFAEEGRMIGLIMETRQAVKEDGSDGISVSFDWGRALVDLLAAGTHGWGGGQASVSADSLKDVLEINRESNTSCSCKTFGIQKADPSEVGLRIIAECEQNPEFYKAIQKALWVSSKRKHDPKAWTPPTGDKMAIDDARTIMPIATDKKPAKKRTPAKKAAAPKTAPAPAAPVPPAAPAQTRGVAPGTRNV